MATQSDLFDDASPMEPTRETDQPFSIKYRPTTWRQFIGHERLEKKYGHVVPRPGRPLFHTIFFGPPGSGKTTLAHILANESKLPLFPFSAVLQGVKELKSLMQRAREYGLSKGKKAIIFIDEIHRFSKSQQDALLSDLESYNFIFLGATTEGPKIYLNKALLSRVHLTPLSPPNEREIFNLLNTIKRNENLHIPEKTIETLAQYCHRDVRMAINILDTISKKDKRGQENTDELAISSLLGQAARRYDKDSHRHYDIISAFIKSLRGSDPNAALLYLAIMLDGGEDPQFIARRLVIFASEDIGNANPQALLIATATLQAVLSIGMPEGRINLAQATTYLATSKKSNASYLAIDRALEYVKSNPEIDPPDYLKNHHPAKKEYLYPHNYPGGVVKQAYTKGPIPTFYCAKKDQPGSTHT